MCIDDKTELKIILDHLYKHYSGNWLESDPVQIPHFYSSNEDIEVSGFLAALFSYGKVNLFLPKIKFILTNLGDSPYRSLYESKWKPDFFQGFYYRFQKQQDLIVLLKALGIIFREHGSLKNLFLNFYSPKDENILPALTGFVNSMSRYVLDQTTGEISHGLSHLIPSPNGGALKRLNMFLRWMVRKDNVDFGLWNEIHPSKLIIPMDTHIYRISGYLGLRHRNSSDMKTAIEVTTSLKNFCTGDPVKYDFALTRIGMYECKVNSLPDCVNCSLQNYCEKVTGNKF